MTNFSNNQVAYAFTTVDSSQMYPLNSRQKDQNGNEYIYLKGAANTVVGSFVTYDEVGVSTLLAANAIGAVAIAMSASVANQFGWYCIFGSTNGKVSAGYADDGLVFATATAGEADDAVVAGDRVKNCFGRSAIASGVALMQLSYPFMDDATAA